MFSDLIVRFVEPYQKLRCCLNFTHSWSVIFAFYFSFEAFPAKYSIILFFDIYSWGRDFFSLVHVWSITSQLISSYIGNRTFSLSHDDLLTNFLALTTYDLHTALWFYFTPGLKKPLTAKKRSSTDSLSEWADFLRARVTWRLVDLAVNNVCGGLAGRCGVHLLSL